MLLKNFGYQLPPELIAQVPADPRDSCRLLVVSPGMDRFGHHVFRELPSLLQPGDCVVINETRVLPARLLGTYGAAGRQAEVLLLQKLDDGLRWEALLRPGRRLPAGATVTFPVCRVGGSAAYVGVVVEDKLEQGRARIRFTGIEPAAVREWLWQSGAMPLPPYIRTSAPADSEDYQTVYSRVEGSVAAPTAGLHFTPSVLRALSARDVAVVPIVLHVGYGTFAPLRDEQVAANRMQAEHFRVSAEAAASINRRRAAGGRVIAVGTTVTRTLESITGPDGIVSPGSGWSDLFIYPGHRFRCVDGLLTNFHLPESSTLLLTAARAGWDLLRRAYEAAVEYRYRFYSFGDAMLVLPVSTTVAHPPGVRG